MTANPPIVTASPHPRVQWHGTLASGTMTPARGPANSARRATSTMIVYSLITATTLFSFWDLVLLGTHAH